MENLNEMEAAIISIMALWHSILMFGQVDRIVSVLISDLDRSIVFIRLSKADGSTEDIRKFIETSR